MYTALELVRAAGFIVRKMPTGGTTVLSVAGHDARVIMVGPESTDAELRAEAARYIELPADDRLTILPHMRLRADCSHRQ